MVARDTEFKTGMLFKTAKRDALIGNLKLAGLQVASLFVPNRLAPGLTARLCRRRLEMARMPQKLQAVGRFEELLLGLDESSVCIDFGANVGEITKLMAATGATTHAFEPDP